MGRAVQPGVIYLDNNATTRPLDGVVEAMLPWLGERYGNPSSTHRMGQQARFAVEQARRQVAALLGAEPRHIVFTAGGTESISLALRGALQRGTARRGVVTSTTEHAAVQSALDLLGAEGFDIRRVGVDAAGRLDPEAFAEALDESVALVSLTHVNAETGVIEEIEALARMARSRGALVHVDAVQSIGKLAAHPGSWGADLVSIAAHKFHGPKGVGALFVADGVKLRPLVEGGGQERGLRGGTEFVAGAVGMGVASEAAKTSLDADIPRIGVLRDRLERALMGQVRPARVIAAAAPRVCNTATLTFPGVSAEALLLMLSEGGICVSSGSACASGSLEPSGVLLALGLTPDEARSTVRFSLSRFTTEEEVERTVETVQAACARLARIGAAG